MLRSLKLRQFRCFESLVIEPGPGASMFVGENAQGKTSILESVCVLLRLQSPRCSGMGDLVKFESGGFGIEGDLGETVLSFTYTPSGKKRMAVDGETQRRKGDYLAGSGLVVWMANDDLNLVRGGGDPRRKYLDFIAAQVHPGYRVALRAYGRALRARNFLLKRDARPDWDQIDAYSKLLVEHGTILTNVRTDLVESLSPWADEAQGRVSGKAEPLGLRYQAGGGDDLAASLSASRDEEARRRQTLVGPHRDDVALSLHGMPAAQFASEGQQRTIALALKLAQAKLLAALRGEKPVMLLDDIFGELDPARRNALLGYLPEGTQKLITTTHLDWARGTAFESARVFRVEGGAVTEA